MRKSLKGALLSALLFPGAGQFWLRRPLRGAVLSAATLAATAAIVVKVGQQALRMLEKAESEGGPLDLVALVHRANADSSSDQLVQTAVAVLLVLWVIGVVDAYLLGVKADREGVLKGRG